MKINVKEVEVKANELGMDLENVKRELKRVASVKCRLIKQKGRVDYEMALESVLKEEQLLKEVRTYITGSKKTVTTFEQEDVDRLTYDETLKAIKSIQSKKTLTKWLTNVEGDNDEYRGACRIEDMLKEHLKSVKPIEDNTVRKSDIQRVIDTIESTGGHLHRESPGDVERPGVRSRTRPERVGFIFTGNCRYFNNKDLENWRSLSLI